MCNYNASNYTLSRLEDILEWTNLHGAIQCQNGQLVNYKLVHQTWLAGQPYSLYRYLPGAIPTPVSSYGNLADALDAFRLALMPTPTR